MQTIPIEYLGRCPKIVELPIPLLARSSKTGQVICNPIGEFPVEDGERLLEISGPGGLFRRATIKHSKESAPENPERKMEKSQARDETMPEDWEKKDFKTAPAAMAYVTRNKLKKLKLVPVASGGRWILRTSQAVALAEPEVIAAITAQAEGHKEE